MKAIIIEDEAIAAGMLVELIGEVAPHIDVIATLCTIDQSVAWLSAHPLPDVAFVDIHLADGSSFAIFEECDFNCPVIFTTAYDQYAIRAFEVNSIGYLLKPIDKTKLIKAIEKIALQNKNNTQELVEKLISSFRSHEKETFRRNILVPYQDKLIPVPVTDIAYFMVDGRQVMGVTENHRSYKVDITLDDLQIQLNPSDFFRVNRQYIVQHKYVKEMTQWFLGKYTLTLAVSTPDKIIVPKARVTPLKEWLSVAVSRGSEV